MMKTALLLLLFPFVLTQVQAQQNDSIAAMMERGIDFYNNGQFELSLVEYRRALEVEPENAYVHYEMALSYYRMGDLSSAIDHAEKASKEKSDVGVEAVILMGAIYDEQGKAKKSIKLYKKAMEDYGDYYLLWFNLGVTASGIKDYDQAAEAFEMAAKNRLDHTESHLALASMQHLRGRRVEAMIPLYFFLLLEPASDRSFQAYTLLNDLWKQGIDDRDPSNVAVTVAAPKGKKKDALSSAEVYVSTLELAQGMELDGPKSEFEQFRDKTREIFIYLGDLDLGERDDYYSSYYIPFFKRIAESEHMDAFVHYIRQGNDAESQEWVKRHTDELGAFFDWLDENP